MLELLTNNYIFQIIAILSALASVISGVVIFYTLVFNGHRWVNTYYQLLTFSLLPLITFIISKVIASNLALSLGMVGALSIVRFRNPVKNSFELILFFALITIGISFGVEWKWAAGLTVLICLAIYFFRKINFENTFFIDESLEAYSLNLCTKKSLDELINNSLMRSFTKVLSSSNEAEYQYVFYADSKEKIVNLYNDIKEKNNSEIVSIQLNV
jgi:hypothetical protein